MLLALLPRPGRFAIAGFMRIFMGVARDRLEGLMAAPQASFLAHVRAVSLVTLILIHDASAVGSLVAAANAPPGVGAAAGAAALCLLELLRSKYWL